MHIGIHIPKYLLKFVSLKTILEFSNKTKSFVVLWKAKYVFESKFNIRQYSVTVGYCTPKNFNQNTMVKLGRSVNDFPFSFSKTRLIDVVVGTFKK
jgi:hypothetical protein